MWEYRFKVRKCETLSRVLESFTGSNEIFNNQEWKIGKHHSGIKAGGKNSRKLFSAPIYHIVQYPPYNVPLNQWVLTKCFVVVVVFHSNIPFFLSILTYFLSIILLSSPSCFLFFSRLASIDKFSHFSEVVEANFGAVSRSCERLKLVHEGKS